jgi:hypothetical protein
MARKDKQSSVVVGADVAVADVAVADVAVADVAQDLVASVPQEAQTGSKKEKRSAARAARQVRGADGKPVHGLTDVQSALNAGYVYGTHGLVRAQFTSAHNWYNFAAWRAEQEAQEFYALAADAAANPAAYKRAQSGKAAKLAQENSALQARLAQLESMLAALVAQQSATSAPVAE